MTVCAGIQNQMSVRHALSMPAQSRRPRMRLSSQRWKAIICGPKKTFVSTDNANAWPTPAAHHAGSTSRASNASVKPFMPTKPALITRPSTAQATTFSANRAGEQGSANTRLRALAATTSPSVPSTANCSAAESQGYCATQAA